jgi:hypothetical protein
MPELQRLLAALALSVHVATVLYRQHGDMALPVVDGVEHPVIASAGRPAPGKLTLQGLSHPAGLT